MRYGRHNMAGNGEHVALLEAVDSHEEGEGDDTTQENESSIQQDVSALFFSFFFQWGKFCAI